MKYAKLFSKNRTPQRQPIPGSGQVRNSAGGYAWAMDSWQLLDRFLILGSEDGTFYIGERNLTLANAKNALECVKADGVRVVHRLVEISEAGRAPKNDPAIFVLALCASYGNDETRKAALEALPRVCRTGTHLFGFASAIDGMRGWGRGLRKAVARWFNDKPSYGLEYQVAKYGQRGGWSHRDMLRLAHPVAVSAEHQTLFKWIADGELGEGLPLIRAIDLLKKSENVDEAVALITKFKIPREAVPTELLTKPKVWNALLQDMPLTAMIRNLGNMSKVELLKPNSDAVESVRSEIADIERIKKARVHPLALLGALVTYASGKGVRGDGSWTVVPAIVDALDQAFYDAFANVASTKKRLVLGLDVSGSMAGTRVSGMAGLECRQAAAAMALVTAATEPRSTFIAFDTESYMLNLSAKQRLDDVVKLLARTGGGGTDCSAPIETAMKKKIQADAL